MAGGNTTNNYYVTEDNGYVGTNTIISNINSQGIASAMIECHFDYSKALQACVGIASFDSNDAIGASLAQRVGDTLISGKITSEAGEQGISGSISWHF